jgi:Fe(3+) dicitrate transport protein
MKGASSIKNGPYTIGGAINLVSTPIPYEQAGQVNLEYGSDNTSRVHAWLGDSKQNHGWLLEAQKHQSDGFATIDNSDNETGFDKEDVLAKFSVNTDRGANIYQQLDVKLQYSTELSDQTYVGLTEADFAVDAHQRYGLTQQDEMDNEHKEFTLTHLLEFGGTRVTSTGYMIDFDRDWFKVDKIAGDGINSVIDCANGGVCTGNVTTSAEANAILQGEQAANITIKHNNRAYKSKGVQSKLQHSFDQGSVKHELEFGVRYHEDSEERDQPTESWSQDANGNLSYVSTGTPSTRFTEAEAWSAYINNEISFGKWVFSPGVRYEDYKIEREGSDTKVTDQQVVLLGLGSTYQVDGNSAVFIGLNEGHSPAPNDGESDPEEAVNFELGARFSNEDLQAESTLFVSDYSNLLGVCTASGGADDCDIGDASNGGAALVKGLELLINLNSSFISGLKTPLGLTYTYTDAEFKSTFSDNGGVWGDVNKGDKLPNLSDHQLQLRAGLEKENVGLDLNVNYFSDTCATAACLSGEEIDSYAVVDLTTRYQWHANTKLYLNIDNLLDSEDVVARAPKNGARAQKPLSFVMGIRHNF